MSAIEKAEMLTPAQRKLLECLMTHGTQTAAAKCAGVTRKTVYTWLRTSEIFKSAVNTLTGDLLNDTARYLASLQESAVTELAALLRSDNERIRLAAAVAILTHGAALYEGLTAASQIERIEKLLTDRSNQNAF